MLKFNGKKFNATDFEKSINSAMVQQAKDEMAERFRSICLPATKEFPTVASIGNSLSDLSLRVEGSKELIDHIRSKLPPEEISSVQFVERRKVVQPKVFLSFGWEDRQLAEQIARKLTDEGIDTWWAEWEIQSGDSLRQRIDEGLGACTHFVVLLSKESINKPWVKQEMDAGLVRMLDEKCKFIPLRTDLPHSELPPLLSGRLSPDVSEDCDLSQLISDIHGISRKPKLGNGPIDQELPDIGFSVAATSIAKVFSDKSEFGSASDPLLTNEDIAGATGLSMDDVEDGLYELRSFLKDQNYHVGPESEFFVEFDKAFKAWNPEKDALKLASSLFNDDKFPSNVEKIAELFGWDARRMNPAIGYLVNRGICRETGICGTYPWAEPYIDEKQSGAIRRFVKSRT
ncbi:hypothetical protein GCM10011369_29890 [Neiella marina]|uniref:TIR domain-containing protein n=1 Tax=Neiella marina TaxID=508461 RepID=A0A8J2XR87_9GAMM|nr:toll/interleukin-1 receptor domain-containing protein [Neiella marina]GGA85875.1 hypothetical protein GCM10011369_29890 [Neiella marina]